MLTAVIAAVLVWQVTTRSLVAYLARSDPEAALSLRSTDPAALLVLADRRLAYIQQLEQLSTPPPSQTSDKEQAAKEPQTSLGQLADLALKAGAREPSETENLRHPADPSQSHAQMSDQVLTVIRQLQGNLDLRDTPLGGGAETRSSVASRNTEPPAKPIRQPAYQ